jgi:hypothetical protein
LESAELVGLAERVGADKLKFVPERSVAAEVEPQEALVTPHIPAQPSDRRATASPAPQQARQLPVLHQALPIAGGEVLLQVTMDGALPPAAFVQVGKVMEELQKLVDILPARVEATNDNLSE